MRMPIFRMCLRLSRWPAMSDFQLTLSDRCEPTIREKIEKDLVRIKAGKLPSFFPRNNKWMNYSSRHWRVEERKTAELVRRYTEAVGHPPRNEGASEQWYYNPRSPRYRGRAAELAS